MRQTARITGVDGAAQEGLHQILRRRDGTIHKRHRHHLRTGLHRKTHFQTIGRLGFVQILDGGGIELNHVGAAGCGGRTIHCLGLWIDVERLHPLAIQRNLQNFIGSRSAKQQIHGRFQHLYFDEVFAVQREIMFDADASAGAQGQPFNVIVLRDVGAHSVGFGNWADSWAANGGAADFSRRRHVAFEQCGRNGQHVGNVIETVTGVVGGQEGRRVHIQMKQIAHRIAVLGSI